MSLDKLISKCKQQDIKAQEELYHLYSGKFYILCLKYSNDDEVAKDNLQEGFIKIFQNIGQYKGTGTFEGWMTRIIINTALKKYKNRFLISSINEQEIQDPDIEDYDHQDLPLEFLIQTIRELPDRYRLVFNLYAIDGYSHKEISELLNISVGTSKSNLARARVKLKEKIQAYREYNQVKNL